MFERSDWPVRQAAGEVSTHVPAIQEPSQQPIVSQDSPKSAQLVLAAPGTKIADGAKEGVSLFESLVPFDDLLGVEEGTSEGELDWMAPVGPGEGSFDGSSLAVRLGSNDGSSTVGTSDGLLEDALLGVRVGAFVGSPLGNGEGTVDGASTGLMEG